MDPVIRDCVESFGGFRGGHPEMWRFYARFFEDINPEGVKLWLAAWSFVRYADDLLDRAATRDDFSETLKWGLSRVEGLFRGTLEPENNREKALQYFFRHADKDSINIFYDVMRAAEVEKAQVGGVPTEDELEKIIEFNAVRPVLLHCRLHFGPLGIPAEKYDKFGRAFGRVTRFADVFVDLEKDLAEGIVPVSKEFLEKNGLSREELASPDGIALVKKELRAEYAVCRRDAGLALHEMNVDRRHLFAYGLVLRGFDWCVYGMKALPGFFRFLAEHPILTVWASVYVGSSVKVAWSERLGKRDR